MKPFNLEKALAGDPVVTKDGIPVDFVHYYPESVFDYSKVIVGIKGSFEFHNIVGQRVYDDSPSLYMAPKKRTVYVNLLGKWVTTRAGSASAYWFDTEKEARASVNDESYYEAIAVPVEIEE